MHIIAAASLPSLTTPRTKPRVGKARGAACAIGAVHENTATDDCASAHYTIGRCERELQQFEPGLPGEHHHQLPCSRVPRV